VACSGTLLCSELVLFRFGHKVRCNNRACAPNAFLLGTARGVSGIPPGDSPCWYEWMAARPDPFRAPLEQQTNTRIGLRTDNNQLPNSQAREHALQIGVLEGIPIVLLDERLERRRAQLADNLPLFAFPHKLIVIVLDPDDGDVLAPGFLHECADIGYNSVTLTSLLNDPILYIHNKQGGLRTVLKFGHVSFVRSALLRLAYYAKLGQSMSAIQVIPPAVLYIFSGSRS
jgi:hypothetical protein